MVLKILQLKLTLIDLEPTPKSITPLRPTSRITLMNSTSSTLTEVFQITHIDFLAINMTEERTVDVPVHLVGEAAGAKEGVGRIDNLTP
jgi:hypothetical protein